MRNLSAICISFSLLAEPAFAAGKGLNLNNTDFVVAISFAIFVGVLWYFGVHKIIGNLLDQRADGIKGELDEARALREEAQTILGTFERKQKDVQAQADAIVERAKDDAKIAAANAKDALKRDIQRRLQAAEDQIKSAEASAVKEVRDQAATIAVAAARDVIAKQLSAKDAGALIDTAIDDVDTQLK
ncbi:MAG: ATP F0F1 synthase subunit B [Pseudomonadota bacterium]